MCALPQFPNEIYDYILDHLHRDRRTLFRCSLVCKEWLSTSRFHLVSLVELRVQDAKQDLSVLTLPLTTITPNIRYLHIDASEDMGSEQDMFEILIRGLPHMEQLKSIRLNDVNYMLSASAKGNLFSLSRGISTLELINVTFQTSSQQTELISSATSLQSLYLSSITYRTITPPSRSQLSPPLKKLQLFDTHSWHTTYPTTSSILKWLSLDSQSPHTLDTLELRGITIHNIPSICAYVHALGNTLENIVIECSEVAAQDALSKELDLTTFTSLKTIVFHTPTQEFDRLGMEASTWIQRILSKVSSQRVQLVSFKFDCHDPVDLAGFDLPGVGKLFSGGISSLSASSTKIHFEVASRYVGADQLRKPIVDRIPSLADRLQFGPGIKV